MTNILRFKIISAFILIYIFSVSCTWAQMPRAPYQPLQFSNLNYNWYQTKRDTTRRPPQSDGYNCFYTPFLDPAPEPLVHKGYIYTCAFRPRQDIYFEGTYIEKRDIKSGNLVWQTYFGFDGNPSSKVEYARLMYINEKNQLEVISQQTPLPIEEIEFSFWERTGLLLTKRIYDINTGALVENIQPNPEVDDYFKSDYVFIKNRYKVYKEKEGIRFFSKFINYYTPDSAKFDFVTAVANPLDRNVVQDTLESEYGYTDYSFFKLKDNEYLIIEYNYATSQLVFKYVDGRFNILQKVISDPLDWNFVPALEVLEYDDDLKQFLIRYVNFDRETGTPSMGVAILDRQINVLKKIDLPPYYQNFPKVVKWKDGKIAIFLDGRSIDVIEENNGQFEFKRIIQLETELKAFVISDIIETEDSYILYLWERALYRDPNDSKIKLDQYGDASSLISIPKSEFWLTSSLYEASVSAKLSPNPCTDILNINFDLLYSGHLVVRNINGSIFKEVKDFEGQSLEINTSDWPSGMYFISLYNALGQVYTSKVVKM